MTERADAGGADAGQADQEAVRRRVAQERRRRSVFGEVLESATHDDRPEPGSAADEAARGDRWLRDNVPPHHGG